jgi:hypothetical protein
MNSTESLITDVFKLIAFVLILIFRAVFGSVKMGIYIYKALQDSQTISQDEILNFSNSTIELLKSEESQEAIKTVKEISILTYITSVKVCKYASANTPAAISFVQRLYVRVLNVYVAFQNRKLPVLRGAID